MYIQVCTPCRARKACSATPRLKALEQTRTELGIVAMEVMHIAAIKVSQTSDKVEILEDVQHLEPKARNPQM